MRASVAFLVMVILALVSLGQSHAQQKTGAVGNKQGNAASQKDSLSKTLLDLTEQVNDLKERIRALQTEQDELRARLAQVERTQVLPDDLREADLELGRFNCETEFNRAHAFALAHGYESYTMEGAAAMDCTQRLAKISQKAVHGLASR